MLVPPTSPSTESDRRSGRRSPGSTRPLTPAHPARMVLQPTDRSSVVLAVATVPVLGDRRGQTGSMALWEVADD